MVNPMPETCVKKRIYRIGYTPQPAGTKGWSARHRSSRGCMASLIFEDHPGGFSMWECEQTANQKLNANQKPKSRESETKNPANQKLKCANPKQNSANQKLRIRN